MAGRRWRRRFWIVPVGVLAALFLGEGAARGYFSLVRGAPFFGPRAFFKAHPVFGWHGREAFLDAGPARPRIFILGDSFTNGLGVPVPEMYYAVLRARLDVGVFAYGGTGYGTLQEYLVADAYLPHVQPDLVLLQVCENDFINNSWPLERASLQNNNFTRRPYYEKGRIVERFPSRLGDLTGLFRHSRLAYLFITDGAVVSATLAGRGWLPSVEAGMRATPDALPYREALVTTELLIAKLRDRVAPARLIAFSADDAVAIWRPIFARQGVPFLERAQARIPEAEAHGNTVRFDGAHWTAAGHRLVGESLAAELASWLPAKKPGS